MNQLSDGDFEISVFGVSRNDEIGDIAGAVERFNVKAVERGHIESSRREQERERTRLPGMYSSLPTALRPSQLYFPKRSDSFSTAFGPACSTVESIAI
jgi:hypothetical protein